MKLGAVYSSQVNAFYRIYLPMMAMRERGHEIVGVQTEQGVLPSARELSGCDLVHVHRPRLEGDAADFVTRLHGAGIAVGFDDDDDSAEAPPELAGIVADGSLERARRDYELMLGQAGEIDLLTTPSLQIAQRFASAGADNVQVIENYLPGAFGRVRPAGHDGLVVGWHAAEEHRLDVAALGLDTVLRRVLDSHPDVRVVTIGIDLDLEHERYVRETHLSIHDLTRRLADFDIGIAPLADTPFNRGRSNVKAREYAAAGVPWLASPVGSYRELGSDEGGQLVEDDDWFAALDELIRSRKERSRMQKRARKWAERETIWQMAEVWEQTFLDTIRDMRAIV